MDEILSEKESETITNKCPNCGATLDYDIESGMLKCAHCGGTREIEQDDKVERRELTEDIVKTHEKWHESSVFRCDGCGAKSVLDKKDISRICPFCGNSNVVSIQELAGIKPDSVIPFQITKDSALEKFRHWLNSRWLAPRKFKTADIRERVNGLYMSSWSFSASTTNIYSGTLGKNVTQVRRDGQGRMVTYTRTDWFRVNGQIDAAYADFVVQSGDRISPIMFSKIKPFDLKLLRVYRQEYLSGIIAEHYTRKLELCFNEFANYIRADIRRKIMRKHNADCVGKLDIKTNYTDRKFNYILLPVYIANYVYNNKTFNFFVNGASGVVVGKYPKSRLKIALIALGVAAVAAGVAVAGYFLGWYG